MITQEKIMIGFRYKEKESVFKKGFWAAIFLSTLSLVMAIILMFIKADEDDKIFKVMAVGLMLFCSVFFLFMIPLINKSKKQILTNNNFQSDAIYFENGYLYLVMDKTIKINPEEIEDVKIINNEETTNYGIVNISKKTDNGSLNIITKNEKYFIPQIINCEKVKDKILNLKQKKPLIIEDIYFVYNNNFKLDEYEAKFKIDNRNVSISFKNDSQNLIYNIDTVKYILRDFEKLFKTILENIAKDILELANEWNEDNDIIFTENDIVKRIENSYLDINISGEDYTFYLDDDDIFFGHSIVYYGSINNDEFSVDIAG
ncbi:MAG: DUF2262 domain-containing protein [Clostridia bacterium]|nr:DUF2262 domain-containing protein [Clostridia bacterium]